MSLRTRILMLVLLATLTPTVVLGLYFFNERDRESEEAKYSLGALAKYAVENLDDKVKGTVQLLHGLSQAPHLDTTEKTDCSEFLADVLAHYPQYTGLLTITPDGDLFCDSLRSGRKLNVSTRDYFKQVRASLEPAFDVVIGGLTGIAVLQVAYPVLDRKGTLKYVLLASLNLSQYAQSFAAASHYPSISLLIWNRKGILMVRKPDAGRTALVGKDFAASELFRFVASGDTGMSAALPGLDGGHWVWALGVMPESRGGGARMVLGISQDMLLAKANKNLRNALLLLFVVSLLAFTLAWYVAETGIRRHVRSIGSVARHIGTDDMGARSGPPYPRGELGELMAVVDRTAEAVQAQQTEIALRSRDLEQVNRMLRALSGINTLIVRVRDRDELFREACRIAVDEGGFRMAILSLVDRSAMKIVPVASAGVDENLLSAIKARLLASDGGISTIIAQAIREEKAVVSNDAQSDPRVSFGKGYAKAGVRSMAILPLIVSNEAIGVLALYAAKPGFFDEKEIKLLTELAGDIAFAIDHIDNQERLEKSNKAKDEFLSVMSHELRTPLNIILGYSNLIKDGTLGEINDEQEKAIAITLAHSKNLLSMVNEILQAARIEAQAIQLVRDEFELSEFINELKSAFELTGDKTLELNWDYSSDLTSINTDREKLMHILHNLVQNAIKFTKQGTIGISAQLASDRGTMEFKVTDTGIGIPNDELSVIFEKFRQVDGSGTRPHEGTGLGLFIVKSFTELLGGSVDVESAVGKGTVFTVRIPCGINQSVMKPITTSLPNR